MKREANLNKYNFTCTEKRKAFNIFESNGYSYTIFSRTCITS